MTTVLRRWAPLLITIVVYAGLVFAGRSWLVPKFGANLWQEMERRPETRRFEMVRNRVQAANNALREIAIWDSIKGVVATQSDVFVQIDTPDTAYAAHWRDVLERQVAAERKAIVGAIGISSSLGSHPDVRGVGTRALYYTGALEGRPYCVAAVPVQRTQATGSSTFVFRQSNLLGPCRLWARYGQPGSEVDAWLRRGGYRFAESVDAERSSYSSMPRAYFGGSGSWWWGPDGQACLAEKTDACRAAVLDSVPAMFRTASIAAHIRRPWEDQLFLPGASALLASAEHEFGSGRFARFWTSPLAPERAFREAFGVELGEWVHEWAVSNHGRRAAGPGLSASSLLLSLLLIGLLISYVVAKARARSV